METPKQPSSHSLADSAHVADAATAPAKSFWDYPLLTGPITALVLYTLIVWLTVLLSGPYVSAAPVILWGCVSPLLAILGLLCGVVARFARQPGKAAAIAGAVLGSAAGIITATFRYALE